MKQSLYFSFLFAVLFLNFSRSSAQEHRYVFNQNLSEANGTGPSLTETLACSATAGTYTTNETLTTTAGTCTGTSTVFSFKAGGGVAYPNTNSFIQSSYTIHTFFKFDDYSQGYARIIDFSNSTSDNGIYTLNNCLNFYPSGSIGQCPYFVNGNYYLITLVRDGTTNQMKAYVNGTLFTTYTDVNNYYKPATTTTPIIFFRDDNVVQCEVQPGKVRYISLSPAVSTDAQVATVWGNICNAIKTLPLKIVSFDATKVNDNNIKISWQTSDEINTSIFEVERSSNGRNFEVIGRVPVSGNERSSLYTFTDTKPATGDNYYRIKSIDKDQQYSYTAVKKLTVTSGRYSSVTYRPATKKAYIDVAEYWLNCSLTIFSLNSQSIRTVTVNQTSQAIDLSELSSGIYYFRLQKNGDVKTEKVLKY